MPSLKPKQLDKANPVDWEPSEDKPKGKVLEKKFLTEKMGIKSRGLNFYRHQDQPNQLKFNIKYNFNLWNYESKLVNLQYFRRHISY